MAVKSQNVQNKIAGRKNNKNAQVNLRKRTSNKKKRSSLKSFIFIFVLAVTVVAAFLFLANRYIFKVGKIEINEHFKYTDEEILAAGGISLGMELYSLPLREIENNIKDKFSYVKNVKLTQIPPSTLRINISMETGVLGIKLGGDYYILSETFKVLEKVSMTNKTEETIAAELFSDNIIMFSTQTIKECYVGKNIQFQDEDIPYFLNKLLKVVKENEIYGVIEKIDLRDKFYVKLDYDKRFLVELGSFEDIETKILTLIAVIDNLAPNATGTFERNNEKSWSFISNNISG